MLLRIVILSLLILFSFVSGFFSNYVLTIATLILFVIFSSVNFLVKGKATLKCVFFGSSILGIFLLFHVGLVTRNSFRHVCFEAELKDKFDSKLNLRPVSLEEIEKSIEIGDDFVVDTLQELDYEGKRFFIKRILPKNKVEGSKILILSGVHGSETASVYAIPEIMKKIRSENWQKEFHFEIIYALNPVGLMRFNRFNECNCDINRDFILFKTTQSKLLRDLVQKEQYDYALDLHEGPYGGHYFINKTTISGFDEEVVQALKKENIPISPMLTNRLKDFLFQYELDNSWTKINQIMPFDNYLKSQGVENILSESNGLSDNFDRRIRGHVIVFEKLMEGLKNNSFTTGRILKP